MLLRPWQTPFGFQQERLQRNFCIPFPLDAFTALANPFWFPARTLAKKFLYPVSTRCFYGLGNPLLVSSKNACKEISVSRFHSMLLRPWQPPFGFQQERLQRNFCIPFPLDAFT